MEKACTDWTWWPRGPHAGPHKVGRGEPRPQRGPQGPICPHHCLPALDGGHVTPAKWIGDGHLFEGVPSTLHKHTRGCKAPDDAETPLDLDRPARPARRPTHGQDEAGAKGCRSGFPLTSCKMLNTAGLRLWVRMVLKETMHSWLEDSRVSGGLPLCHNSCVQL